MEMSMEQEEKFLADYSKAVWRIVNAFKSGQQEDLYQEAMVTLLAHARQARSEEELKAFPRMAIKNAICRYLMKQEVVSFPKTRTTDYAKVVKSTKRTPLESAYFLSSPETEDQWIFRIDLDTFLSALPERARDMFVSKVDGEKPTEIARRMGLTPGAVTHSVQKTMKRFMQERNIA